MQISIPVYVVIFLFCLKRNLFWNENIAICIKTIVPFPSWCFESVCCVHSNLSECKHHYQRTHLKVDGEYITRMNMMSKQANVSNRMYVHLWKTHNKWFTCGRKMNRWNSFPHISHRPRSEIFLLFFFFLHVTSNEHIGLPHLKFN